jgi:hypothetical protein
VNSETVKAGRDRYLAENSLSVESYSAPRFPVYVGRWPVYLPNPGFLPWHDLHHVITGYQTGLVGEAEISAYELRAGCRSVMIIILCLGAILIAMFVAPRRIWRAWRRAKGARTLYRTSVPYQTLLEMNVADLRESLGLPRDGCV